MPGIVSGNTSVIIVLDDMCRVLYQAPDSKKEG